MKKKKGVAYIISYSQQGCQIYKSTSLKPPKIFIISLKLFSTRPQPTRCLIYSAGVKPRSWPIFLQKKENTDAVAEEQLVFWNCPPKPFTILWVLLQQWKPTHTSTAQCSRGTSIFNSVLPRLFPLISQHETQYRHAGKWLNIFVFIIDAIDSVVIGRVSQRCLR